MSGSLEVRPVTKENRAEFEAFFSSPGAPHYCWCMVWRRTSAEAKQNTPAGRKTQMLGRIGAGVPVGLLAYRDGEAVGWVSVAPRDTYRNLGGSAAEAGEKIWSIVCFYVPRKLRGEGLVRKLIAAAVAHAKENGASIVEAYPVPPEAPSYRFMGFIPVFTEAGFTDVGMAGKRRHAMRLVV